MSTDDAAPVGGDEMGRRLFNPENVAWATVQKSATVYINSPLRTAVKAMREDKWMIQAHGRSGALILRPRRDNDSLRGRTWCDYKPKGRGTDAVAFISMPLGEVQGHHRRPPPQHGKMRFKVEWDPINYHFLLTPERARENWPPAKVHLRGRPRRETEAAMEQERLARGERKDAFWPSARASSGDPPTVTEPFKRAVELKDELNRLMQEEPLLRGFELVVDEVGLLRLRGEL